MAARFIPLTCSGHTRPVVQLSFSPLLEEERSYLLVSSCKDGNPMLRDWTGDWIGTFIGHKGAVWCTKLCADTSKAASGSADFTAKVWDTYTGEVLHSFPHNHIVRTIAISPNASHLLTAGHEKKIRLFDLARPDAPPVLLTKEGSDVSHDGVIKSIVWDRARAMAVSAGDDRTVRWWDLRQQKETHSMSVPDPITSMGLSVEMETLCLTAGKSAAFIPLEAPPSNTSALPAPSGPDQEPGPSHVVALKYAPSSASIHPIWGDRFTTGSMDDPWVRVHGYPFGEEMEVFKGHHGPVHCVEYSPDGEMYASGSEDGTIRLWQTTPGTAYGLWRAAN
ncbi:hypothetical protein FRB94_008957 [Tulasnella sp. JGI-2019a]|nr:hypothetical protein FRB93_003510 [Tulasnella sp. JGI-2019a]KAG9014799.1 hypothetical protein FRB94_008957 [Tulasnella sp. JGI-2019a]KAG9040037.1 hypothetical protein FRB95_004509 [Tulasnella sp. JGI-2019a]